MTKGWKPLSDETKQFHRDRYRDFFSRPKFSRPRLFFETKYFRDRYWDFFWDQMFSRPIPRLFFDTKRFWDWYWDFAKVKKQNGGISSGIYKIKELSPPTDYSWRINESWVLLLLSRLLRGQIQHIHIQQRQLQKLKNKIKEAFSWFL